MSIGPLRKIEELPPFGSGPALPPPNFKWWRAPSKSFNNREYGPIDTIVLHATAGSSSEGAMTVTFGGTASWHWLIPDENEEAHEGWIWRCVENNKKAWHVRRNVKFPIDGKNDINSRSIGIEIVNAQSQSDKFSDWQVRETAKIVNYHRSLAPSQKFYVVTHSYLDPSRRNDPGTNFDWDKFMGYIGSSPEKNLKVVGPDNKVIECDPTWNYEYTKVIGSVREVAEALGYKVFYVVHDDGRERVYIKNG